MKEVQYIMRPRKFEYLFSIKVFYKNTTKDLNVTVHNKKKMNDEKDFYKIAEMITKDLNADKVVIIGWKFLRAKRAL